MDEQIVRELSNNCQSQIINLDDDEVQMVTENSDSPVKHMKFNDVISIADDSSQELAIIDTPDVVLLEGEKSLEIVEIKPCKEPVIDATKEEIIVNTSDVIAIKGECIPKVEEVVNKPIGECLISVNFATEKVAKEYKEKFLEFISGSIKDFTTIDSETELKLISKTQNIPRKESKNGENCEKVDETPDLFILDTIPSARKDPDGKSKPRYNYKYKTINDIVENDEEEAPNTKSANVCYNCGGNHMLKDCPEPKDYNRINAQRMKNKQKTFNGRYHIEENEKYGHLKAGKISDRLRRALGLGRHEIPPHVYKMRVVGYPPGWLEEVKNLHSNLSIIDGDGKESANCSDQVTTYDFDKIVDYEGFNSRLGRNAKDRFYDYGVPPYSPALNKEVMIDFLNNVTQQQQQLAEQRKQQQQKQQPEQIINLQINDEDQKSPTLIDLEAQKEELLSQLQTDDINDSQVTVVLDLDDTAEVLLDTTQPDQEMLIINESDDVQTPKKRDIKFSTAGTPIIKALSPFARLPNPDNFSKDVSAVINFENLPDSTGKYEQMATVLDKVRKTLKGKDKT